MFKQLALSHDQYLVFEPNGEYTKAVPIYDLDTFLLSTPPGDSFSGLFLGVLVSW